MTTSDAPVPTSLCANPWCSDCVVVIAGERVPAHAIVLASKSRAIAAAWGAPIGKSAPRVMPDEVDVASESAAEQERAFDFDAIGAAPDVARVWLRLCYDEGDADVNMGNAADLLRLSSFLMADRVTRKIYDLVLGTDAPCEHETVPRRTGLLRDDADALCFASDMAPQVPLADCVARALVCRLSYTTIEGYLRPVYRRINELDPRFIVRAIESSVEEPIDPANKEAVAAPLRGALKGWCAFKDRRNPDSIANTNARAIDKFDEIVAMFARDDVRQFFLTHEHAPQWW